MLCHLNYEGSEKIMHREASFIQFEIDNSLLPERVNSLGCGVFKMKIPIH